jgi:hypothetical protein
MAMADHGSGAEFLRAKKIALPKREKEQKHAATATRLGNFYEELFPLLPVISVMGRTSTSKVA